MAGIFISYAREDVAKARAIAGALEQVSFEVWFDERIHSGTEFSREIEQALRSAAAVVVLWSRHSIESPWVRDEAAEGRDSGLLVPILLDKCRPPIGFRQFQTTDLSNWSGRGTPKELDQVIRAVHAKAGAPSEPRAIPLPAGAARFRRRIALAAATLAIIVITAAALLFVTRTDSSPAAPSLALLPFTADSSDPESRKLASAVHDAVAHTLSQGAFSLKLIDSMPPDGPGPADFVISGQLTSDPKGFLASIRMDETAHRSVVFSTQFNSSRDEVEGFAERVGAQLASQLSWTAPLIAIEKRHPSDPAVVAALLGNLTVEGTSSALKDYQEARRIALKAPNSAIAQMSLGMNTGLAVAEIPRSERAEAVALARRAGERARQLAPEFGEPFISWCLLHSPVRLVECEQRLRAGMRIDPDAPFPNWFLSAHLNDVGRIAESAELAQLSLAHDPYMPFKIALAVRMLEVTGRTDEAAQLYAQGIRWWPDNPPITWFRRTGLAQRGDFGALQRFNAELGGDQQRNPVLAAINRKSLPAVQSACATAEGFNGILCMLALARFGDSEAAFAFASRLYPSRIGRTPAEEDRIWLDGGGIYPLSYLTSPAAVPLRRDPRYLEVAKRVGLLDYWRSGRPPDFCRTRPEPICPRLLGRT